MVTIETGSKDVNSWGDLNFFGSMNGDQLYWISTGMIKIHIEVFETYFNQLFIAVMSTVRIGSYLLIIASSLKGSLRIILTKFLQL